MVEYSKVNVKLTDTQLKKLKRNLRMNLKMLDGNDLPHDLLFKTRQKVKLKNAYNNNCHVSKNCYCQLILRCSYRVC